MAAFNESEWEGRYRVQRHGCMAKFLQTSFQGREAGDQAGGMQTHIMAGASAQTAV